MKVSNTDKPHLVEKATQCARTHTHTNSASSTVNWRPHKQPYIHKMERNKEN